VMGLATVMGLVEGLGAGSGPGFIGGSSANTKETAVLQINKYFSTIVSEGTKQALDIYEQYITYKQLMGLMTRDDAEYYAGWNAEHRCIGACPQNSQCTSGFCSCEAKSFQAQKYGRCFPKPSLSSVGDKDKYRKPYPPPRPAWCFCRDRNNKKAVCPNFKDSEECKETVFPNLFDPSSQLCRPGDHGYCIGRDINMICGEKKGVDKYGEEKNVCECRKDMKFDTEKMECRLYIDVDCTDVVASDSWKESNLTRLLAGELMEPEREYSKEEIRAAFCNLIYEDENSCSFSQGFSLTNLWHCICSWFQ